MLTVIKLIAAGLIALGVLSPMGADTCECKAKAGSKVPAPQVDTCQCKASA